MKKINEAIRAAGVVWRPCSHCGRDWPFPTGFDPSQSREWTCQVCCQADLAAMKRKAIDEPR